MRPELRVCFPVSGRLENFDYIKKNGDERMHVEEGYMALRRRIDLYLKDLKEVINELEEAMDKEPPDFEQIQSKGVLYEAYRRSVILNDRIAKELSRLGRIIIATKDLKRSLFKRDEPLSYVKSMTREVEGDLGKLYKYQTILNNLKGACDQELRFYSSVQYILCSPKLQGFDI